MSESLPTSRFTQLACKDLQPHRPLRRQHKKQQRQVRFADHVSMGSSVCTSDVSPHQLWYSQDDFEEFKQHNIVIFRKILRGNNIKSLTCVSILGKTFMACDQAVEEEETSDTEGTLTPTERVNLKAMITSFSEEQLLGLEYYVIRCRFGEGRQQRKRMLMEAISKFDADHETKPSSKAHHPDYVSEELRQMCQRISRPCRLFALHLAQARSSCS